jgi:hypothetical protein
MRPVEGVRKKSYMIYHHLVRHRQFYAPGTYKEPPLSNLLVEMTYTAASTKNICFNSQYRDS